MQPPGDFNPQAIENHYGLELACQMVSRLRPRTVRICTPVPAVAAAAVRRLHMLEAQLSLEDEAVAAAVEAALGVRLRIAGADTPNVALVPFARRHYPEPPRAGYLVLLGHNAASYKGLLRPGAVADSLPAQLRWLRRRYSLGERVGLYGPRFLLLWALSLASGSRWSEAHFLLGQRALDSLYTTGVFWWTGYITVLCGRQR